MLIFNSNLCCWIQNYILQIEKEDDASEANSNALAPIQQSDLDKLHSLGEDTTNLEEAWSLLNNTQNARMKNMQAARDVVVEFANFPVLTIPELVRL